MRLGVLDVGSNTVHLLLVDAYRGAHPWPAYSEKSVLRLAERIGVDGRLGDDGVAALADAVGAARKAAAEQGARELVAFATSALREATNAAAVLARVRDETGVELAVLSGEEEARLTFLAVRRWFGWSAGRLLVLDIGGGSLEIAAGIDEEPELAISLPLGAGRLTRQRLVADPPSPDEVADLRDHVQQQLAGIQVASVERAAATSKTFRSLARLAGSAPAAAGLWTPRSLSLTGLHQVLGSVRHVPSAALAEMDGVSPARAHQLVAGAVVAQVVMTQLGLVSVDLCPWALREGVIFGRLDSLDSG